MAKIEYAPPVYTSVTSLMAVGKDDPVGEFSNPSFKGAAIGAAAGYVAGRFIKSDSPLLFALIGLGLGLALSQ